MSLSMPVSVSENLIDKILKEIEPLLKDNNPNKLAIVTSDNSIKKQPFTVKILVGLRTKTYWNVSKGKDFPSGSKFVDGVAEGSHYLCGLSYKQALDGQYLESLIEKISSSSATGLTLTDAFISETQGAVYTHKHCGACGGSGKLKCNVCSRGRVKCPSCDGHGEPICTECGGHRMVRIVTKLTFSDGDSHEESHSERCLRCLGSGRSGHCWDCSGTGRVECQNCRGTGKIPCEECHRTGWLTEKGNAEIYSVITKEICVEQGASRGIEPQLIANGMEWCSNNAEYRLASRRTVKGSNEIGGEVVYEGSILYGKQVFFVARESFEVEALGFDGKLLPLPPLLMPLLNETAKQIEKNGSDVVAWYPEVQKSKILMELYIDIARATEDAAPLAFRKWRGAVTLEFLENTEKQLKKNLKTVGRKDIFRIWLLGTLVLVCLIPTLIVMNVWPLVSSSFQLQPSQIQVAAFFSPSIFVLIIYFLAYFRWRFLIKRAVAEVPKVRPCHSWLIMPVSILFGLLSLGTTEMLYWKQPVYSGLVLSPSENIGTIANNLSTFREWITVDRTLTIFLKQTGFKGPYDDLVNIETNELLQDQRIRLIPGSINISWFETGIDQYDRTTLIDGKFIKFGGCRRSECSTASGIGFFDPAAGALFVAHTDAGKRGVTGKVNPIWQHMYGDHSRNDPPEVRFALKQWENSLSH